MKLTFNMTGEEYYSAWKYKLKNDRFKNIVLLIFLIFIYVCLLVILKSGIMTYMIAVSMLIFILFMKFSQKKSVISQFYNSPAKCCTHTICIYDEGVELINSYEKMFAPWQSIYLVKETNKNIIILLSYSRGIAVINKKRYCSPELENIMSAIQSHITVREGR